MDAVHRPLDAASPRVIEAAMLLQAVTELHGDGMLSNAEYETKRQRLIAQR